MSGFAKNGDAIDGFKHALVADVVTGASLPTPPTCLASLSCVGTLMMKCYIALNNLVRGAMPPHESCLLFAAHTTSYV